MLRAPARTCSQREKGATDYKLTNAVFLNCGEPIKLCNLNGVPTSTSAQWDTAKYAYK